MDSRTIVKTGYDAVAARYATARSKDSDDVRLLQELIDRLPEGAKLLDVGCGSGVPITKLLSEHFDVTGVDFSETQIGLARRLVPQAQFICQDMAELAFPAA